jgi:hypothetical protein
MITILVLKKTEATCALYLAICILANKMYFFPSFFP